MVKKAKVWASVGYMNKNSLLKLRRTLVCSCVRWDIHWNSLWNSLERAQDNKNVLVGRCFSFLPFFFFCDKGRLVNKSRWYCLSLGLLFIRTLDTQTSPLRHTVCQHTINRFCAFFSISFVSFVVCCVLREAVPFALCSSRLLHRLSFGCHWVPLSNLHLFQI